MPRLRLRSETAESGGRAKVLVIVTSAAGIGVLTVVRPEITLCLNVFLAVLANLNVIFNDAKRPTWTGRNDD